MELPALSLSLCLLLTFRWHDCCFFRSRVLCIFCGVHVFGIEFAAGYGVRIFHDAGMFVASVDEVRD